MANLSLSVHLNMKRNSAKSLKLNFCLMDATLTYQLQTKRFILPPSISSDSQLQAPVRSSNIPNSNMIFVGKLQKNIQHEVVYGYFQKFGTIAKFIMPKQATPNSEVSKTYKGFAYITYASPESANSVLNYHHILEGKSVILSVICPEMPQPIRSKTQDRLLIFIYFIGKSKLRRFDFLFDVN